MIYTQFREINNMFGVFDTTGCYNRRNRSLHIVTNIEILQIR